MSKKSPVPGVEQGEGRPRLVRGLRQAEDIVLAALFVGMFLVVTVEIVTRSLFGFSNLYSEELSRILLIASVYFGVALVTRDDEHIRFDLLDNAMPDRMRFAVAILADLLVLAFCLVAVVMGVSFAYQTATIGLTFTHSYLPFPVWVAHAAVPLAFTVTSLHVGARLALRIRAMGRKATRS